MMQTLQVSSTRPWLTALSIAIVALVFSPAAQAQWKWRDAGGRVTISDTPPPPGVPDKDVLQRPVTVRRAPVAASAASASASAPAALPVSTLETEVEARRRKAEEEQKAKEKAVEAENAARRADNCARARAHLRALEEGLRMARVNEKGEREILDDKGRAAEAQRARSIIASDCK